MGNTLSLHSLPLIIMQFSFLTAIALLVRRVLYPTILQFPWPTVESNKSTSSQSNYDKNTTVVLAGSYNPPHNGHLAMLSYLSKRYGNVIAVIGMNPNKKYEVLPEERASMLRKMIDVYKDENNTTNDSKDETGMKNVRVEVVSYYIWRFAMQNKCKILFRGIRSWSKDGKEEMQLLALNTWGPIIYGPLKWPLPTIYLEGDPRYNHISSTLIREICQKKINDDSGQEDGKNIETKATELALSSLVPKEVTKEITIAYSRCS